MYPMSRRAALGVIGGAIVSGGSLTSSAASQVTLKLSHFLHPGHLVDEASKKFAQTVSERSEGRIQVEVYPAGQMFGLRQGAEAVQVGTVDFAWCEFGTLSNWVPELGFVSLPFLFKDYDHVLRVYNGEVGSRLIAIAREQLGIDILSLGISGFRVISSKGRSIVGPEDLSGMRIRVPEIPMYVSAFRTLGANPTPMALGEVYTALQTGVIDAVEIPPDTTWNMRVQEVADHISRTRHVFTDIHLVMNSLKLEGLNPADQEIIRKAASEVIGKWFNQSSIAADEEYWEKLSSSMKAENNPSVDKFRDTLAPIWKEFIEKNGPAANSLVEQIASS